MTALEIVIEIIKALSLVGILYIPLLLIIQLVRGIGVMVYFAGIIFFLWCMVSAELDPNNIHYINKFVSVWLFNPMGLIVAPIVTVPIGIIIGISICLWLD